VRGPRQRRCGIIGRVRRARDTGSFLSGGRVRRSIPCARPRGCGRSFSGVLVFVIVDNNSRLRRYGLRSSFWRRRRFIFHRGTYHLIVYLGGGQLGRIGLLCTRRLTGHFVAQLLINDG
jgi:hypothetical protein